MRHLCLLLTLSILVQNNIFAVEFLKNIITKKNVSLTIAISSICFLLYKLNSNSQSNNINSPKHHPFLWQLPKKGHDEDSELYDSDDSDSSENDSDSDSD